MITYSKAWRWLIASVLIVMMISSTPSLAAPAPVREPLPVAEDDAPAPPAGLSGAEWASGPPSRTKSAMRSTPSPGKRPMAPTGPAAR